MTHGAATVSVRVSSVNWCRLAPTQAETSDRKAQILSGLDGRSRHLSRSAHNPKVAGSNPAPATNNVAKPKGSSEMIGRPLWPSMK
jgi:hypothetical protein